jgi:hypothetical protein
MLSAGQQTLNCKAFAVGEPVAHDKAERAGGIARVRGERAPFIEGKLLDEVESEMSHPEFMPAPARSHSPARSAM